jgi:hypothetical protein
MNVRLLLVAASAIASLSFTSAHAAFHLFRIDQIYSNADGSIQYVVMREATGTNGENFWSGLSLRTTNAAGVAKNFQIPSNLPSSSTASRSVLIATAGFAALNLVTPDFTIPAGFISTDGGTLDYASGTDHINLPPLPTDGATAIDRNGTSVPATPKNFAGATAALTAPPPTGAASPDLNQHGLTGSWFEPATSGQGIEVEFFHDLVAPGTALVQGAWFTFDAAPSGGADRQRWYTFSGNGQSGKPDIPITIYQNTGGNFDAPPITSATVVGSGTLAFTDCTRGSLAYTFSDGSGRTGTIPLTRLLPNVTCTVGTAPVANADFDFSGNWYDVATSGQGFLFEVNPVSPFFFLTWYTYAPTGQSAGAAGQRWFTGQAGYAPGGRTITATLYETTGGLFNQVTNPAPSTVAVGIATVTLANCTSVQLQFNFTSGSSIGKSGTIALSRVGPVPPGCQNNASMPTDASMPGMGYPGYGGSP